MAAAWAGAMGKARARAKGSKVTAINAVSMVTLPENARKAKGREATDMARQVEREAIEHWKTSGRAVRSRLAP